MSQYNLHLSLSQFNSLKQFSKSCSGLSPFISIPADQKPSRLTNAEIVMPDGSLRDDFKPIIETLANPQTVFGFLLQTEDSTIDIAWCLAKDISLSIANEGSELRLQYPSPVTDYINLSHLLMGSNPEQYFSASGELDLLESWVLWAMMDCTRMGKDVIILDELFEFIKNPNSIEKSLCKIYQQQLNLASPSRTEIEKALFRLVLSDLALSVKNGFSLTENMTKLTRNLIEIKAKLLFRVNEIDSLGDIAGSQYMAFQGTDNTFLVWFENNGRVTYRTVTPLVMAELINELITSSQSPESIPVPPIPTVAPVAPSNPPSINQIKRVKIEKSIQFRSPKKVWISIFSILGGLIVVIVGLYIIGSNTIKKSEQQAQNLTPTANIIAQGSETPNTLDQPTSEPATNREPLSEDLAVDQLTPGILGDYYTFLYGRVTNKSDYPVMNVILTIDLKDSSGNTIASTDTNTLSTIIGAKEVSYFMVPFELDGTEFSDVTATVIHVESAKQNSSTALLDGNSVNFIPTDFGVDVKGEFVNLSDQPVNVMDVFAVALDANGQLIGADRELSLSSQLRPGENLPVKINMDGLLDSSKIHEVQIFANTVSLDEVTDPPISVSSLNNIYRNQGNLYMSGEVLNTSDKLMIFRGIVAALYDSSGELLDVATSNNLILIQPNGTTPFSLNDWGFLNSPEKQTLMPDTYVVMVPQGSVKLLDTELLNLKFENVTQSVNPSTQEMLITGNIHNYSSEMCTRASLVLALRDNTTNTILASSENMINSTIYGDGDEASMEFMIPLPEDINLDNCTLEYYLSGIYE